VLGPIYGVAGSPIYGAAGSAIYRSERMHSSTAELVLSGTHTTSYA